MELSIIIVNWNTRDMLRDCLTSIEEGSERLSIETFVIDNASKDDSVAMVSAEFPWVKCILNTENRGFATATNQGIRVATGRYLLLLNPDTRIHENVLADSVNYLEAHPDVGMMGCKVLNTDGSTQVTCSRYPSFTNLLLQTLGLNRISHPRWLQRYQMLDWDRSSEREVEVISGCYLMTRRETVDQIGLLDEAFFLYGEETDWCRRCAAGGWKLIFSPVGCITHLGSGSISKLNVQRDLLLTEGTVRLHRKHGGDYSALAVWLLLLMFNGSRSIYWSLRTLPNSHSANASRANHFRQVVRYFSRAWPSLRKQS
ncbi:MAG: glycosyltransferase family 2 protein [Halioglobus sp.]|nr:glycosyltransferase family 2 protein [Halioglobus sp.]